METNRQIESAAGWSNFWNLLTGREVPAVAKAMHRDYWVVCASQEDGTWDGWFGMGGDVRGEVYVACTPLEAERMALQGLAEEADRLGRDGRIWMGELPMPCQAEPGEECDCPRCEREL